MRSDKSGRYVASHVWTVVRVSRRDGVIVIGDAHGLSHWTYDLAGRQREKNPFTSTLDLRHRRRRAAALHRRSSSGDVFRSPGDINGAGKPDLLIGYQSGFSAPNFAWMLYDR